MDLAGLAQGLAVKRDYNAEVNDLYRNQAYREHKQQQAQQRAKMFADDMQYTNAMNAFDHKEVSDFAKNQIKENMAWIRQHPNYLYDPELMAEWQEKKRGLTDNEKVRIGLQVDAAWKAMEAFQKDPKNADVQDLPEMVQYRNQLANYFATGSITGNRADRFNPDGSINQAALFSFKPPFEGYNTTPDIIKYAHAAKMSGINVVNLAGGKSVKKFVTDVDKADAVNGYLNDAIDGRKARYEYNHYVSGLGENSQKPTLEQYWLNKFNPYFQSPDYGAPYRDPNGKDKATPPNFYDKVIENAKRNAGTKTPANPDGVYEFLVGANQYGDVNNAFFMNDRGNMQRYGNIGSVPKERFNTSNSKFYYNPSDKKTYVSHSVLLTPNEAKVALLGNQYNNADDDDVVHMAKMRYGAQLVEEPTNKKDGSTNKYIQAEYWREINPRSSELAQAYNHGIGTKQEASSSGNFDNRPPTIIQDGIEYHLNPTTGQYE